MALLYLAVRMCFRTFDYRPDPVNAQISLWLALIAMSMEPVRTTPWLGQINVLLLGQVPAVGGDGPAHARRGASRRRSTL